MSFRIELSFMPASELRRVAKDSIRQQRMNSAPYHRRKEMMGESGKCPECGAEDCDCDEYEDENDSKVEMSAGEMPPTAPVTTEDLPRGMKIRKPTMPKKVATKNGNKK